MLRLVLLFCLFSTTVRADDIFGKSRMRFVTPSGSSVITTPTVQKEEPVVTNNTPRADIPNRTANEQTNQQDDPKKELKKAPVFDGEEKVRNFMKPDFTKREVMSEPSYRKKWYVRNYYNSLKAVHDELDRKEALALEEAQYKGEEYLKKLRHRLRVERPFILSYRPSEDALNEALNKDPRNVMYQILTHSRFYPNADEMTEENKKNVQREIEKIFKEQSGFSISEFEEIDKKVRSENPPVVGGENLFKNSVYFE
jgi:hypothetical protein